MNEIPEPSERGKTRAGECLARGVPHVFHLLDDVPAEEGGQGLSSEVLPLVDGIGEAVEQEVDYVRDDRLSALMARNVGHVPVRVGVIAEQNFAHYADARARHHIHGDGQEVPHHGLHVIGEIAFSVGREVGAEQIYPFFLQLIRVTGRLLVGARVVCEALQHVTVRDGNDEVVQKSAGHGETGLGRACLGAQNERRHIVEAGLMQGFSQQGGIVGGAAGAAGLREHERAVFRIDGAALQGVDELADDHL